MSTVVIGALVLLLVGLILLWSARNASRGMPAGIVIYDDNNEHEETGRVLYSARYNLAGRPDHLIRAADGVIPVESKSARSPRNGRPHDGHVAQLVAYCLLVREDMAEHVPYGVVRYSDRCFRVPFTPKEEAWLLRILDRMRDRETKPVVHRSHKQPWRCRSCSLRERCNEALR